MEELFKNKFLNIINSSDKNISFKSCILIYGNSGIGKTYTIYKICNKLNLNIINITNNNCSSSEEFYDILFKSVTVNNFIYNNLKKIVIIDNYETILAIDRTINNTLFNILNNKKFKNIGIICIFNKDLLKKIGNIKKKCEIIEFEKPSDNYIYNILTIKFPHIDNIKDIIKKSDNNIQQAIFFCENKNYLEMDNIDTMYNIEYLYCNDCKKSIINKILLSDTWLIPLRFHENLPIELNNRKTTILNKNNFYKLFIYDLCIYDLLMNNNILHDAIDIISMQVYFLSLIPKKKYHISKLENFTKLLSYLSLQKKYMKKGYIYSKYYYQIGNYQISSLNINLYT